MDAASAAADAADAAFRFVFASAGTVDDADGADGDDDGDDDGAAAVSLRLVESPCDACVPLMPRFSLTMLLLMLIV